MKKVALSKSTINCIGESLACVSDQDGVVSCVNESELTILDEKFDNYLVAGYLARMMKKGEVIIKIPHERLEYLNKLLHLDK